MVGNLGRRGEVWGGAQGTHSLVAQHTRVHTCATCPGVLQYLVQAAFIRFPLVLIGLGQG